MKILVYNKMKNGMSYEDACEQLKNEIRIMNEKREKWKKGK